MKKNLDIDGIKYYIVEKNQFDKIDWALWVAILSFICNILLVLENAWNISIQLSKLGG